MNYVCLFEIQLMKSLLAAYSQKKNRPDINPTIDQGTAVAQGLVAGDVAGLNGTEIDTHDRTMNWYCSCGEINLATKSRCSSCQKWKGGKRGPLKRKERSPIKQVETENIALPIQGGMPVVPIPVVPRNKIGEPWTCKCGNHNGHKNLRCLMCQSYKVRKEILFVLNYDRLPNIYLNIHCLVI